MNENEKFSYSTVQVHAETPYVHTNESTSCA